MQVARCAHNLKCRLLIDTFRCNRAHSNDSYSCHAARKDRICITYFTLCASPLPRSHNDMLVCFHASQALLSLLAGLADLLFIVSPSIPVCCWILMCDF